LWPHRLAQRALFQMRLPEVPGDDSAGEPVSKRGRVASGSGRLARERPGRPRLSLYPAGARKTFRRPGT